MEKILAKSTGETLSEHTVHCLEAAEGIVNSLPFPKEEKDLIGKDVFTAVSLHDAGKAARGFQEVMIGKKKSWDGKRHEIVSAAIASSMPELPPAVVFSIITGHKMIPSDPVTEIYGCLPSEQIPTSFSSTPVWLEMSKEWEDNRGRFLNEWRIIQEYITDRNLPVHKIHDFSLNIISLEPYWLERLGKQGQRKKVPFRDRYYASMIRGITMASDHLGSSHHKALERIPDLVDFTILNRPLRPFQKEIKRIDGSAILRAPTGSGKTEAALLWAQNNQKSNGRLFYVLPYTASINAMHKRLSRIFQDRNVGLMHHRATAALYAMMESNDDMASLLNKQKIAKTLTDLSREIWFPIRVCTPHQILRYTLRGKGWEAMLVEFPNSVFIFDEIHAYDPRVVGLTIGSAKLLKTWGARFLFLSATLPEFLQKLLEDNLGDLEFIQPDESKAGDKEILDKKRHDVSVCDGSIMDHLEEISDSISKNRSTLIVCNHIGSAQAVYEELKKKHKGEDVKLLHGQFNQRDRNRIENRITNESLPRVLVATQVVEVSLDVDFHQAFLEPAPIDALIQRMGRVNRSGSRPPANIRIFNEQISSHRLYCDCTGDGHKPNCRVRKTLEELQRIGNPVSETDLVQAANQVYKEGYEREDKIKFGEGLNHPDLKEFEDRLLAGAHQNWVETIIEQTDGIAELLPIPLKKEYDEKIEQGLWIEANSLLVPIRFVKIIKFFEEERIINTKADPWTINCFYDSEEGLNLKRTGCYKLYDSII